MPTFFLPYQRAWIEDRSRLKIMVKSRQIGISWASAYSLVRRQYAPQSILDAWVSSRDENQAKLFLRDCKGFARILNLASGLWESKSTQFTLMFPNKTCIHSLSSNPDAQAGKRGGRVLDEFALHKNPYQLYAIAYPGITWGGQLEIISTHRGSHNFFNKLVQETLYEGNPKGFSLHSVTLQDALDQGFLDRLKAKLPEKDPRQNMDEGEYFDYIRASCPDEESFRQEYMCVPSDDSEAFFAYNLIASCEYDASEKWEIDLNATQRSSGVFYLGVDIARDHDLTVFWLLEGDGLLYFTRKVICLQNKTFAEQAEVLGTFLKLKNLRRVCIDQTGLGRQFVEDAVQRFGKYRVEGVTFTPMVKETLAYALRTAFEDRSIRIPSDDLIRADLRAIKRVCTVSGNIRFAADRGKNGHADRFWALALAYNASSRESSPSHYESLSENYSLRHKPSRSSVRVF